MSVNPIARAATDAKYQTTQELVEAQVKAQAAEEAKVRQCG